MKRLLLSLLNWFIIFFPAAHAQKPVMELTFTARYYGQYVPLDSIYIENLTQGGNTMLYYPDTVLLLDYLIGISKNPTSNVGGFVVMQNHPNPFSEQTSISIIMPEAGHLQVSVLNLLGQKVAFFEKSLSAGNHSFVFYPGDEKQYLLAATVNGATKSIKMVYINHHSCKSAQLIYQGSGAIQTGLKSSLGINGFGFSFGDQLRFIGYAGTPSDIGGSDVIEATPVGNENYLFKIVEGLPCHGKPTVTYEGKTYTTVQIENQCWFKQNLNVGTMIPGIQNQTNNSILEKFCFDNLESICDEYGGLYQWDEIMNYSTQQGTQGICPEGWHIPANSEWITLSESLFGEYTAGGKMKEAGNLHWNLPNFGATNESGFTGLPASSRSSNGTFSYLGYFGAFWSSTEDGADYAWQRNLNYNYGTLGNFHMSKSIGYSVRCLMDVGFPTIPVVNSVLPINVTQTTAISGGEVVYDGGTDVIARGVCWSTITYPTIADSHTLDGMGVGSFISQISGITPNTQYFLRAYAINSVGTVYGIQYSFTTYGSGVGEHCPGIPNISYGGQTYNTVQIGTQCWLKENLNIGTMINGNLEQTNNNLLEKYCYYNDPTNCAVYGGLYQWDEMMKYTTQQGSQGICPENWHLPTDEEISLLTDFLGGENVAGGKLKEAGILHWASPNNGATNESGFSLLPGGERHLSSYFFSIRGECNWWSSTIRDAIYAWHRVIVADTTAVYRHFGQRNSGFSVRCLKNINSSTFPTVTTSGITNITQTTATGGGKVTNDGVAKVTACGICWSTSQNPTIADGHTEGGTETFVGNLTGLKPNTPYYVRAYATNSVGTAYGDELSFIPL
jgi:uncharacterized protein (TIGR02145 family)